MVNIRMPNHSLFLQIFNQKWFTWKLRRLLMLNIIKTWKHKKSLKLNLLFDRLKRANVNLKKINHFFNIILSGLIRHKHIFQIDLISQVLLFTFWFSLKKESASSNKIMTKSFLGFFLITLLVLWRHYCDLV